MANQSEPPSKSEATESRRTPRDNRLVWDRITSMVSVGVLVVAIFGVIAAFDATESATDEARRAYDQAYSLQGTQTCVDFRGHLVALQDRGLSDLEVVRVLTQEDGVTDVASGDTDPGYVPDGVATTGRGADTELATAHGCGDPRQLLRQLRKREPK
jgi:hypothetical protein